MFLNQFTIFLIVVFAEIQGAGANRRGRGSAARQDDRRAGGNRRPVNGV
jgi:hypothetical protein